MINMRNDWTISENGSLSDVFYNKEESIQSVKDNFDFRRFYTAEGYDIEINGVMERCLVQTSSNPLRELNDYRKIHCPVTSNVRRGYYVKYENSVWIIDTNVVNVDGAYLSTRMSRCQYLLIWQNQNGDIIEKWGYSSDQTKYSGGESGNNTITIGDNQYGLLLPIDNDTKLLKRGMRFAVDFDDAEEPDIYRLTNRKVKLNDETHNNRGGTMTIALTFDFLNKDIDKRVLLKDGREVWICGYVNTDTPTPPSTQPNPDETTILKPTITFKGTQELKIGGSTKTLTGNFVDSDGNTTTDIGIWEVITIDELLPHLEYTIDGNTLKINVLDTDLIDSKVRIMFSSADNTISTYLDFDVVSIF